MRNTFPNHPDELSSSHKSELSYGYWDKTELWGYLAISPKIAWTISCVWMKPNGKLAPTASKNPFAGRIGSKQEHTAYRHPAVSATLQNQKFQASVVSPLKVMEAGLQHQQKEIMRCRSLTKSFSNHRYDNLNEYRIKCQSGLPLAGLLPADRKQEV